MKYSIGIIAALLLVGGWYVLSNNGASESESSEMAQSETEKLSIVTSFYPLQFILEQIVGDLGTITNIGEGKDPHDFEPTIQNVLALQKADLVVLQGADFEPWGDDVIARLEADGVPVTIATANIELHEGGHHDEHGEDEEHEEESDDHEEGHGEEHGDAHGDEHGTYDPHTWLDPVLFSEVVANLTDEVVLLDPSNATVYRANAATLQSELATLDTEHKNTLAACELDEVITSHDAFGYLAERYEFEIHAIAGLSTQDTPSAITLAGLREEAEEGISAILLEQSSITAYGETLARETGLETLSINPISYIVPVGENYLTLMQSNLNTFAIALKCNE
ncbi:MAG: zinc transport system substrate-binding protein [Acidimicrobiales bacterium]|jgi:zinc transport system substrate-binding protein